ncbi:TPA: DNA primase, partial [Campylobacter fetus subsp. venerealis]|nr:DNA primase [Campylobacter fetus subsp. venerealis]
LTKNYYLKQDKHGNILIPLRDIDGKHWASQRIFQNGDKVIGALRSKEEKQQNITYPAKKQGNFFILGAKNLNNVKEVFVCEGFATAASVYEATKNP